MTMRRSESGWGEDESGPTPGLPGGPTIHNRKQFPNDTVDKTASRIHIDYGKLAWPEPQND